MPEPIEYDPFEMDWPWPGMHPAESTQASAPEPSASEPSKAPESEEVEFDYEELR